MTSKVALIIGAGGVLGCSLAHEFTANGYTVFGLRREDEDDLSNLASRIVKCELQNPLAVRQVTARIVADYGKVDVLICNAAQLTIAPFNDLALANFEQAWLASVGSAVSGVQSVLPNMIEQGRGAILLTGATASIRGGAHFAAFAAAKFALRGLAQSLAREVQAQGIHVAHVVIDGLLRGSPSQVRFGTIDDKCIDPRQVAKTYRWLAEQNPSSWTHELDIRPSNEKF